MFSCMINISLYQRKVNHPLPFPHIYSYLYTDPIPPWLYSVYLRYTINVRDDMVRHMYTLHKVYQLQYNNNKDSISYRKPELTYLTVYEIVSNTACI